MIGDGLFGCGCVWEVVWWFSDALERQKQMEL